MSIPNTLPNNVNLVEIKEGIYLYKNFLDNEILSTYKNKLKSFTENDWHQHGNFEIGDHEDTFWGDKCSLDIINRSFHDEIFNFFAPIYWMYQHDNFVRLKAGQFSELDDNHRFMLNDKLVADYKIALYLGDFTGGAINFPELNFKYTPEENDLLVFKIDKAHSHRTETVLSGTRYAYMDCLVYHPGYFMP